MVETASAAREVGVLDVVAAPVGDEHVEPETSGAAVMRGDPPGVGGSRGPRLDLGGDGVGADELVEACPRSGRAGRQNAATVSAPPAAAGVKWVQGCSQVDSDAGCWVVDDGVARGARDEVVGAAAGSRKQAWSPWCRRRRPGRCAGDEPRRRGPRRVGPTSAWLSSSAWWSSDSASRIGSSLRAERSDAGQAVACRDQLVEPVEHVVDRGDRLLMRPRSPHDAARCSPRPRRSRGMPLIARRGLVSCFTPSVGARERRRSVTSRVAAAARVAPRRSALAPLEPGSLPTRRSRCSRSVPGSADL